MNVQNLNGQSLGQYELRELLGAGGMGAVYRGYQAGLKRVVAVKVLALGLSSQEGYVERFIREATTAAGLEHPHIVPVYDFGTQEDVSYIVMRLLTGGSLAERLSQNTKAGKPLPSLGEISQLLRELASALDYAHSQGVIHRDVKPGNVMFDTQGGAYLVDFGIAKLSDSTSALTGTGMTVGTPSYMPPEQWRSDPITPAADQYALGVLIYNIVTGHLPFEAPTPFGLMHKHINETPPVPSSWRPDLPEAVGLVLNRAMAKTPAERFETVTAFAQAFDRAIQGSMGAPVGVFTAPLAGKPIRETPTPLAKAALSGVTSTPSPAPALDDPTVPPKLATAPPTAAGSPTQPPITSARGRSRLPLWIGAIVVIGVVLLGAVALLNRPIGSLFATVIATFPNSTTLIAIQPTIPATSEAAAAVAPSEAQATLSPEPSATPVTLSPEPSDTPLFNGAPYAQIKIPKGEYFIIRAGPGSTFARLSEFRADANVKIIGRNSNSTWLQVQNADTQEIGWITYNPRFVTIVGDLRPITVVFVAASTIDSTNGTPNATGAATSEATTGAVVAAANTLVATASASATATSASTLTPTNTLIATHSPTQTDQPTRATTATASTPSISTPSVAVTLPATVAATTAPTRSAAAARIIFTSGRDTKNVLSQIDLDGSHAHALIDDPAVEGSPAFSPDSKQIAFTSFRDGTRRLYVMAADGTDQKPVLPASFARFVSNPAWSPDGKQIAFDSERELFIVDVPGGTPRKLTAGISASWSPSGKQIVFTNTTNGHDQIYTINADGSGQTLISDGKSIDFAPAWSPDGRQIAFISTRDKGGLFLMNVDGTGLTTVTTTGNVHSPAWSPDGKQIAFVLINTIGSGLSVINTDGTKARTIRDFKAGLVERADWSPNGKSLIFTVVNPQPALYVMNADGTGAKRLLATDANNAQASVSADGRLLALLVGGQIATANSDGSNLNVLNVTARNPALSPDGTQIAFTQSINGASNIYVMAFDGSGTHMLTHAIGSRLDAEYPRWSPNGRQIAFTRVAGLRSQIVLIAADGTHERALDDADGNDSDPAWSPDGTQIVFASTRKDGKSGIYAMNADGSNVHRLSTTNIGGFTPAWSPDGKLIAFAASPDGAVELYVMNADGSNPHRLTDPPFSNGQPAWLS